MKTTKLIGMLAVLAMTSVATAAEEGFKISGDFAASYFGESGKGLNGVGTGAGGTRSTHDVISVDMLELNLEKSLGNTDIMVGIGYGRVFDSFNNIIDTTTTTQTGVVTGGAGAGGPVTGAEPKDTLNLTDVYIHHKFGDTGVHAKVGRFQSGIGYETYNYMDNLNYTRSYGFGIQPVFLTGLNVAYAHQMFDAGVTIANSIANTDTDENLNKVFLVQGAVRPIEGLSINLNYLTGKEGNDNNPLDLNSESSVMNAVVAYKWMMMNFAVDYTMYENELVTASPGKDEMSSIALYAGYGMDNWGAGLRYEMWSNDPNGTAGDEDIDAITVSGHYDIDQNARVKLEVGMQNGEDTSFVDDEAKADDSMMFYGVAAMYRF